MKLRCFLLSLLKIHHPDCQRCARGTSGEVMRKRLEELGWRTHPSVSNYGDHAEGIELGVFNTEPRGVVSTPIR
jgi:hypothetical protein